MVYEAIPNQEIIEIELEEMGSFVDNKEVKTWVWLALERSSCQITGLATGEWGSYCGQMLWSNLPINYQQKAIFYTDSWRVYDELIPVERCRQEPGGTVHIEPHRRTGSTNTLRQQQSHLTPEMLSFVKTDDSHFSRTLNFINHYNKNIYHYLV